MFWNILEQLGNSVGSFNSSVAIYGNPLAYIYGTNLQKLQLLQSKVDLHNVMALAAGWKF